MKKYLIILSIIMIIMGVSCQHGGVSSNVYLPIIESGINARGAVDIGSTWERDDILTESFRPVITGWSDEEVPVDMSKDGAAYTYQADLFGDKKVNITVEHYTDYPINPTEENSERIDVVVYTGLIDAGEVYAGLNDRNLNETVSFFQSFLWTDSEGTKHFRYEQQLATQQVVDGDLKNQYVVVMSVKNAKIDKSEDLSNITYSSSGNIEAGYFIYDKAEGGSSSTETYRFSSNCEISQSNTSFSIVLNDIESSGRTGERAFNSYVLNDNSYWEYLVNNLGAELSSSRLYKIATGDAASLAPNAAGVYVGYIPRVPITHKLTHGVKTFTKSL